MPKAEPAKSSARKPTRQNPAPKLEAVKTTESALLGEWLSSPAIEAWAVIPTIIDDEGLRPFLFVDEDRKGYFGAASVLGQLTAVVERLFGGQFAVQGLEADLKLLAPPEAAHVFRVVRGRIVGADAFVTEPPGAAGLAAPIKAPPTLKGELVDLVEVLPRGGYGPWVRGG